MPNDIKPTQKTTTELDKAPKAPSKFEQAFGKAVGATQSEAKQPKPVKKAPNPMPLEHDDGISKKEFIDRLEKKEPEYEGKLKGIMGIKEEPAKIDFEAIFEQAGGDEDKMQEIASKMNLDVPNGDLQGMIEAFMDKKTGMSILERYQEKFNKR